MKYFKFFLFVTLFLSLGLAYSEISIKNSDGNTDTLAVLLKYDDLDFSFYYTLPVKYNKKLPFIRKINNKNKKLSVIKIYSLPLKDKDGQEITKSVDNKNLVNGGKVSNSILSEDDDEFLMRIDGNDLADNKNYVLTNSGRGLATSS